MRNQMTIVLQLAIGLVFLLSVAGKLINPREFARGVAEYRVLPDRFSHLAYMVGLLIILAEVFLAAAHLTGRLLQFGALLGVAVLASFAVGVALNLKRGRLLPCYCFGNSKNDVISARTLARLALLMAGEAFLLAEFTFSKANNPVSPVWSQEMLEIGLTLLSAIFLLVFSNWLLDAAGIVELLRSWRNEENEESASSKSASSYVQKLSRHQD